MHAFGAQNSIHFILNRFYTVILSRTRLENFHYVDHLFKYYKTEWPIPAAGMQPLRSATMPRREALLFAGIGPRKLLLRLRVGQLYYYWVNACTCICNQCCSMLQHVTILNLAN